MFAMSTEHKSTDTLRIATAQLNPVMGDIAGNILKAKDAWSEANRHGADLVIFTELFVAGYPPEDLVLKPSFSAACEAAVAELARITANGGPGMIPLSPVRQPLSSRVISRLSPDSKSLLPRRR